MSDIPEQARKLIGGRGTLIRCQTCMASIGGDITEGGARALGWRIWDGLTLTGVSVSARICPACIETNAESDGES